jgi:hypothetical protein
MFLDRLGACFDELHGCEDEGHVEHEYELRYSKMSADVEGLEAKIRASVG